MATSLIGFASIYCPLIQFPKQVRTSVHTILLVAHLQYFLHPHLSKTRQTFEASVKLVQTEEYPYSVAYQPRA